mmetsp:Transcript_8712/g.23426  ORF Transcript_8712/g.23426 Transcript_8712/m.23426 type:complete len:109 (+) Transcript_8712:1150-1476(+)
MVILDMDVARISLSTPKMKTKVSSMYFSGTHALMFAPCLANMHHHHRPLTCSSDYRLLQISIITTGLLLALQNINSRKYPYISSSIMHSLQYKFFDKSINTMPCSFHC